MVERVLGRPIAYTELPTEQPNPASRRLDRLSPLAIVRLMNREDRGVVEAVGRIHRQIARAVELLTESLAAGGRLFFVGAGTSGRLGVMEAAECPPTFNTSPRLVQGLMAGGRGAVFRSREGAEDRESEARRAVRTRVRSCDVVVGIAASGVTPFVRGALAEAKRMKARRILLACNATSPLKSLADVLIAPLVGPEVLTGSTRLKAGTATKMVLNMLTTASMVRLGKVYGNWMVDLKPSSRKLRARALALVTNLAGVPEAEARRCLRAAGGRAKVAIVMARKGVGAREARRQLDGCEGLLGRCLDSP